jgi:hypothetical protein
VRFDKAFQKKRATIPCPYCAANRARGFNTCTNCGAALDVSDVKKPLLLRAGILLMRLNALLILYCVALNINIANLNDFHISDPNVKTSILIGIAILKLVLIQLLSNGINWARMSCLLFFFWPHGSGTIYEFNIWIINHLSTILLFLSPSNKWFRSVEAIRKMQSGVKT